MFDPESLCNFGSVSRNGNRIARKLTQDKKLVVEVCDFMICSKENCDVPVYKQYRNKKEIQDSKKSILKQQYIHSRKKRLKYKIESSEEETSDMDEDSNDKECNVEDFSDDDEVSDEYNEVSDEYNKDPDYSDRKVWTGGAAKIKSGKYQKKKKEKKTEILNSFQLMRQKNLEDKMAFLNSLNMKEIVNDLEETTKSLKIKAKRIPKPKLEVSRRSKRMENISINYSEEALENKPYEDAFHEKKLPVVYSFEDALYDDRKISNFFHKYYDSDFGDLPETRNAASNLNISNDLGCLDYRQCLNSCDTPFKVSSFAFHSSTDRTITLTGSFSGHIALWNTISKPYIFIPHTDYVSLVKSIPQCPFKIVSSSHDGTLRQLDLEKKYFLEIFKEDTQCNHFDCMSSTEFLVAQSNGCVSLVDTRDQRPGFKRGAATQWRCSNEFILSICAHPTRKEFCLSLDSSGLMKVWDLRFKKRFTSKASTGPNAFSATFSPVTGNSILCSSKQSVSLYDSSDLKEILEPQWMLNIQPTSNDIVEEPIKLMRSPKQFIIYYKKLLLKGLNNFYTMANWMPNSESAFLVFNNVLKKVMILNSDEGKEMKHFSTPLKVNFQAVHPVHNMLGIVSRKESGSKIRLYLKDVLI